MASIALGDLGALAGLYDRHQAAVRAFVTRLADARADVDDLVHETFLGAAKSAQRYDGRPSARPFLLGIASRIVRRERRLAVRFWRGLAIIGVVDDAEPSTLAWGRDASAARGPEGLYLEAEQAALFSRALERLTHDKRAVYLMMEREGMSGEAVAAALEIPIGTVWSRFHYAVRDLRKSLAAKARR